MNNRIIQLVLWLAILASGWYLVEIIMEPIRFNKKRDARYEKVIDRMMEIRTAQQAFKDVNGYFAGNFDQLTSFIDTGEFTILQRRDTSFMAYDPVYRTDLLKDSIVVDTLGFVSIKDSLFSETNLSQLKYIPGTDQATFVLDAGQIDRQGYSVPVMRVIAPKEVILKGLSKNLIKDEEDLILGSLSEANLSGNW